MYKGVGRKPEELRAFVEHPNKEIEKKRAFVEWKKTFEGTTTKCIFGGKYFLPQMSYFYCLWLLATKLVLSHILRRQKPWQQKILSPKGLTDFFFKNLLVAKLFRRLMISLLNTLFSDEIILSPNIFIYLLNHIWWRTILLPKPIYLFILIWP